MNKRRFSLFISISLFSSFLIFMSLSNTEDNIHSTQLNRAPSSVGNNPKKKARSTKTPTVKTNRSLVVEEKLERNTEITKKIYNKMSSFPSSTQPLDGSLTLDPIEQKFKPQIKSVLGLENQKNELIASIPKSYFTIQDQLIHFQIKTMTENLPVNAQLQLIIDNKELFKLSPLQVGVYEYNLSLEAMKEGSHMVTVIANFSDEEVINQLHFRIDKSLVTFIKSNSVEVDTQGNLVFSNNYQFYEAGTYLVEGTLYSESNELIGKGHTIFEAGQGVHTVELNFYGYLLYQLKQNGHFSLKNIQINQVDEHLITRGNYNKQINQRTEYLTWKQFSSMPYENKIIQEKVSLLQ